MASKRPVNCFFSWILCIGMFLSLTSFPTIAASGSTTFAFTEGETTVAQMMARINAATPAYHQEHPL